MHFLNPQKVPEFDVFIAPPKRVFKVDSTLWENDLCPRGLCYVTLSTVKILPELWQSRLKKRPVVQVKPTSSTSQAVSTTSAPEASTSQSRKGWTMQKSLKFRFIFLWN